jgi:hypothetical protein
MKLKNSVVFVSLVVATILLTPSLAPAQDMDPPKCCNAPTGTPLTAGETSRAGSQGRIIMSDAALRGMGLSRSQFIDHLGAGLLPNRQLTVIFSIARSVENYWPFDQEAVGEQPAQVILQYRIQRERMRAEQIDALDQLAITDGEVQIEIYFKREPLSVSLP